MRIASPLFTLGLAALVVAGCRRNGEEARGNRQAERIAEEATLTNADIDRSDASVDEALREQADSLAAFRREQLTYRARVRTALDAIDHEGVDDARARALGEDLDAIGRSTEVDWPAWRIRIDRDLRSEGR